MPSDRPSIDPISTSTSTTQQQQQNHSRPEIATKSLASRITPSLPSPPLSPLQIHTHGSHCNGKRLSLLSFPSAISQSLNPLPEDSTPSSTPIEKDNAHRFGDGYLSGEDEEPNPTAPMLPSQLRRRHESLRRQRSVSMQSHPSSFSHSSDSTSTANNHNQSVAHSSGARYDSTFNNSNDSQVAVSSHTKSIMKTTPDTSHRILPSQGNSSDIIPINYSNTTVVRTSLPGTSQPEMNTRDWVKMQCKIQALETEVSHVSRTNTLLNQELDKVTAHLSRLLNSEVNDQQADQNTVGAGPVESWRREYEFLVQQVDLMHRQLQLAQSEQHARARFGMEVVSTRSEDRSQMTQQLYSEVKDLTASLKMWQAAFQQADEKYRRKCDGERILKETLRDRESQLSTLVDKLSGCESEFRKSISNYDEMMRLSAKIEVLESQQHANTNLHKVNQGNVKTPMLAVAPSQNVSPPTTASVDGDEMPGSFPGELNKSQTRRRSNTLPSNMATPASVEHVSVSILSWATLLATYMLS
ncbi:hypothetical protein FBU30_000624 [Linnemannia zychae]|nr:hypothetical protein FBU30_000624 [Linnemannia zychae]